MGLGLGFWELVGISCSLILTDAQYVGFEKEVLGVEYWALMIQDQRSLFDASAFVVVPSLRGRRRLSVAERNTRFRKLGLVSESLGLELRN